MHGWPVGRSTSSRTDVVERSHRDRLRGSAAPHPGRNGSTEGLCNHVASPNAPRRSLLAVSALAVMAVPASASMPAASSAKFCAAAAKTRRAHAAHHGRTHAELKGVAADFKSAAKSAPPKVKKAMLNVASLLNALGTKDAATWPRPTATAADRQNYTKAITTYSTYVRADLQRLTVTPPTG